MSSIWIVIIGIALALFVLNAAFAYRYRSRQMRRLGQEPPPFLVYLFRPEPLTSHVSVPRPLRIALGFIVFAGGVFFLFIALLLFTDRQMTQLSLFSSIVVVGVFTVLGAAFTYVGVRLMSMARDNERLFGGGKAK